EVVVLVVDEVVDEVVVLVVDEVVVLVVVDVVVLVVVGAHCAGVFGGLNTTAHEVGSAIGTLQEQVPALHWPTTKLVQALAALPVRAPPSMTVTSSVQVFVLQVGGAALAPETKTPVASTTVATKTAALLVVLVIVGPPPLAVPFPLTSAHGRPPYKPFRYGCQRCFFSTAQYLRGFLLVAAPSTSDQCHTPLQ